MMKKNIITLFAFTALAFFTLMFTRCQVLESCPLPAGKCSESFVLGYRSDVDNLLLSCSSIALHQNINGLSYFTPEPIFKRIRFEDMKSPIKTNDSIAIVFEFELNKYSNEYYSWYIRPDDIVKVPEYSEKYGDTNFRRHVSPYTSLYKTVQSGRIVIEDRVSKIIIKSNHNYSGFNAGDDVSSLFVLAYTNPIKVAQENSSFTEREAGLDYEFVKFSGNECNIPDVLFNYDKEKEMYKMDIPAPFQWYDGEYFPSVIYQKLTEVPFSEIKHLSAMAALIPTVYPNEFCEVSFTIEVHFSNGKILSGTTPMMMFSGL